MSSYDEVGDVSDRLRGESRPLRSRVAALGYGVLTISLVGGITLPWIGFLAWLVTKLI